VLSNHYASDRVLVEASHSLACLAYLQKDACILRNWTSSLLDSDQCLLKRLVLKSLTVYISLADVDHLELLCNIVSPVFFLSKAPFDNNVQVRVELTHMLVLLWLRLNSHLIAELQESTRAITALFGILEDYSSDSQRGDIGCKARFAALESFETILNHCLSNDKTYLLSFTSQLCLQLIPVLLRIYVEPNAKLSSKALSLLTRIQGQSMVPLDLPMFDWIYVEDKVYRYESFKCLSDSQTISQLLLGLARVYISPTFDEDQENTQLFLSLSQTLHVKEISQIVLTCLSELVASCSVSLGQGLLKFASVFIELPFIEDLDPVLIKRLYDSSLKFCKVSSTLASRAICARL
jgi:hypothetical protein